MRPEPARCGWATRGRIIALLASLIAASPAPASGEPLTLGGISFSDELGGVELKGGAGGGSLDDPFVLTEDITDDGPAVLVVRGLRARGASPLGSPQQVGFALRKVVTNRTPRPWHVFELELREQLESTSDYEDGLSFAQATRLSRPFLADRYTTVMQRDEPLDAVEFSDGIVEPGETVTVSVVITDYTPRFEFYILQRRESPIAVLGDPRSGG